MNDIEFSANFYSPPITRYNSLANTTTIITTITSPNYSIYPATNNFLFYERDSYHTMSHEPDRQNPHGQSGKSRLTKGRKSRSSSAERQPQEEQERNTPSSSSSSSAVSLFEMEQELDHLRGELRTFEVLLNSSRDTVLQQGDGVHTATPSIHLRRNQPQQLKAALEKEKKAVVDDLEQHVLTIKKKLNILQSKMETYKRYHAKSHSNRY
ncbi:hypothetical protein BJ944DRAFT_267027 [Cunninghamella echinulata]|nr:hypothetical protein BJ944DRAFT_267027 [Cunninghamella echinulata]